MAEEDGRADGNGRGRQGAGGRDPGGDAAGGPAPRATGAREEKEALDRLLKRVQVQAPSPFPQGVPRGIPS